MVEGEELGFIGVVRGCHEVSKVLLCLEGEPKVSGRCFEGVGEEVFFAVFYGSGEGEGVGVVVRNLHLEKRVGPVVEDSLGVGCGDDEVPPGFECEKHGGEEVIECLWGLTKVVQCEEAVDGVDLGWSGGFQEVGGKVLLLWVPLGPTVGLFDGLGGDVQTGDGGPDLVVLVAVPTLPTGEVEHCLVGGVAFNECAFDVVVQLADVESGVLLSGLLTALRCYAVVVFLGGLRWLSGVKGLCPAGFAGVGVEPVLASLGLGKVFLPVVHNYKKMSLDRRVSLLVCSMLEERDWERWFLLLHYRRDDGCDHWHPYCYRNTDDFELFWFIMERYAAPDRVREEWEVMHCVCDSILRLPSFEPECGWDKLLEMERMALRNAYFGDAGGGTIDLVDDGGFVGTLPSRLLDIDG